MENKSPEWPQGTTALLSKRISGTVIGQDYVDWAVLALMDGFDSPSLAILAGLDMEGIVSRFEADGYFEKVIQELGLLIPDDDTVLRRHVTEIVEQIREGTIDPETGVDRIHREVVTPLRHPPDLQPWCYLWEGNYPDGTGMLSKEQHIPMITQFARDWLSQKSEE